MSRTEQHTFLVQAQTHTELVEEALSLIAAMYGSRYPAYSTFDILIGAHQHTANKTQTMYVTRAIVYKEKTYKDWEIVEIRRCAFDTAIESLENFVKMLREEFGIMASRIEQRAVGNVRDALGMAPLQE